MTAMFVYTEDPTRRMPFVVALTRRGFGAVATPDTARGAVLLAKGLVAILGGDSREGPTPDAVATAVVHLLASDACPRSRCPPSKGCWDRLDESAGRR